MIDTIPLGSEGLHTSRLGLGCMGMSEFYIGGTVTEFRRTIREAIACGITMFDTADMYGPFTNEQFVGTCLRSHRSEVLIATKFGYVRRGDGTRLGLNGRPEYVKSSCDASLRRLRSEYIDLYYLHRVDRTVPIEETVGAMADLVRAGKVRYLGLSEVTSDTLRRAHAVHPISAVQSEYSLATRDLERDLFGTLRALNVGFVAYAPLGRGLLSGRFKTIEDVPLLDYRRSTPRFLGENLQHNATLVTELERLAAELLMTPSQLALAWVRLKIGDSVILVGTGNSRRLLENIASLKCDISPDVLTALDAVFKPNAIRGDRYPDMTRVNG